MLAEAAGVELTVAELAIMVVVEATGTGTGMTAYGTVVVAWADEDELGAAGTVVVTVVETVVGAAEVDGAMVRA